MPTLTVPLEEARENLRVIRQTMERSTNAKGQFEPSRRFSCPRPAIFLTPVSPCNRKPPQTRVCGGIPF